MLHATPCSMLLQTAPSPGQVSVTRLIVTFCCKINDFGLQMLINFRLRNALVTLTKTLLQIAPGQGQVVLQDVLQAQDKDQNEDKDKGKERDKDSG